MRRGQQGLTLIGFIMVLIVAGFFAYIAMLLVPMYTEYFQVVKSLKGLAQDPDSANFDENKLRDRLSRRFDIGYVTSILPKDVKIKRDQSGFTLSVDYEVRKQIGNTSVFLLCHFTDTESSKSAKSGAE